MPYFQSYDDISLSARSAVGGVTQTTLTDTLDNDWEENQEKVRTNSRNQNLGVKPKPIFYGCSKARKQPTHFDQPTVVW